MCLAIEETFKGGLLIEIEKTLGQFVEFFYSLLFVMESFKDLLTVKRPPPSYFCFSVKVVISKINSMQFHMVPSHFASHSGHVFCSDSFVWHVQCTTYM